MQSRDLKSPHLCAQWDPHAPPRSQVLTPECQKGAAFGDGAFGEATEIHGSPRAGLVPSGRRPYKKSQQRHTCRPAPAPKAEPPATRAPRMDLATALADERGIPLLLAFGLDWQQPQQLGWPGRGGGATQAPSPDLRPHLLRERTCPAEARPPGSPWTGSTGAGRPDTSSPTSPTVATFEAFSCHPPWRRCCRGCRSGRTSGDQPRTAAAAAAAPYPCTQSGAGVRAGPGRHAPGPLGGGAAAHPPWGSSDAPHSADPGTGGSRGAAPQRPGTAALLVHPPSLWRRPSCLLPAGQHFRPGASGLRREREGEPSPRSPQRGPRIT